MSASLLLFDQTFNDANGSPLSSGKVWTYVAGTNTPKATWSDFAQSSLNTNPVQLNAAGRATIFGEGGYKVVVMNSADVIQYTRDFIFPEVVPSSSFPDDSAFSATDFGTLITKGSGTRVWSEQQEVLLTEFADIQINTPAFDNGPGLQAAFDALAGTGKVIRVPAGTFYLSSTVTLRSDNTIVGGGSQCIFRAAAPITMFRLERSQNANRIGISGVTLYGFSSTDPTSIGIYFGPTSGDANWTVEVKDIVFANDSLYTGIAGTAELDGSVIENCRNLGGIFGYAFIDLQLAQNSVAPSAGLIIRNCHCAHQQNDGWNKNRVGIRIQGGDCVRIEGCIINGFDYNFDIWSKVTVGADPGRVTYTTSLSHCHTEDFRSFVMDFAAWEPSKQYFSRNRRVPTVANGYVYRIANGFGGTSGGTEPTWPTTIGNTVVDGSVTWTCHAYNSRRWEAAKSYPANFLVKATKANATGWIYESSGGTSGGTEPVWPTVQDATVVDGSITWTAKHTSVTLRMIGSPGNHKVAVRDTLVGQCLIQFQQESGKLLVENVDNFVGNSGQSLSDISYQYIGTTQDAAATFVNSSLRGNFKPFVTAADDSYVARIVLDNTNVANNLIANLIEEGGAGRFSYYYGTNNAPDGGTRSTSGAITLSPEKDYSIAAIDTATVTVNDTTPLNSGKKYIVQALTSNGVTLQLQTGNFNYMGHGLPYIFLPTSSAFVELLSRRAAFEVLSTTTWLQCRMRQVEASGTSGGALTAGAWNVRSFNEELDASGYLTVGSSPWTEFTLPAGVYDIRVEVAGYNVGDHAVRIYNVTDSTILTSGMSSTTGAAIQSVAAAERQFVITATNTFRIEQRVQTTNAVDGAGKASSFGDEIYSMVIIDKLI